jgi:HEAT repeat protein
MLPAMNARALIASAICLVVALAAAGCEKTNHENIEKWMKTQKGPGKLKAAVSDSGLDADLSAHAAENLIRMGQDSELKPAFAAMAPERAQAVMAKLAPRLWERARVEREDAVPSPINITAKDALFDIRQYAADDTKQQIDGYLIDWYAVSFYDKRATLGNHQGSEVIRMIGEPAGARMIAAANTVVARPEVDGKRVRITDELLLGLALAGTPETVKYILEVAVMDKGDETLAERALSALFKAFITPDGNYTAVDPVALKPNLDALIRISQDDSRSNQTTNDAVDLIRAVGAPDCIAPLVALVKDHRHDFRYRGASNALRCGGPKVIADVVHGFPTDGQYSEKKLGSASWRVIAELSPREAVLKELRALLSDASWLARWIAIEALAEMKSKEDIERIRGLSGDKAVLEGFWGPQDDAPAKDRKKDPTLGARAKELAAKLGG